MYHFKYLPADEISQVRATNKSLNRLLLLVITFIIIHLVQFTQLNYIMFLTDWFIHVMQLDAISLKL